MHLRPRLLSIACGALWSVGVVSQARAAGGDKAASAAYETAMYEDYLNTDFDGAVKHLQEAIDACGKDKCSGKVLAKLHMGVGVVLAIGKKQTGPAKEAFVTAIQTDSGIKVPEDFANDDLQKIFKEAQADAKAGPGPGPEPGPVPGPKPAGGDLEYEPPEESVVNTPLPIFIKVPADLGASKVTLRYKPFGGTQWNKLEMEAMAGGFGATIPCAELTTTGKVRFYISVADDEGSVIATAGTLKRPHETKVSNELEGEPPTFPGEDAPRKCTAVTECPPDFPGCATEGVGWGGSCNEKRKCGVDLMCKDGVCETDDGTGGDGGGDDDAIKKNWIALGAQLDVLLIDSAQGVCGASTASNPDTRPENYFCFNSDGSEFLGRSLEKPYNEIQGGGMLAGGRLMVGYDRLIWHAPNPMYGGFVLGARVGVGLGGSPSVPEDQVRKGQELESHALNFFMFHGEVRAAWYFLLDQIANPFFSLSGGFGQINAGVDVAVCDMLNDNGVAVTVPEPRCQNQNAVRRQDITAYQITGLNFFGFSVGAMIHAHTYFAIQPELRFMFMLPTFGVAIAPMISPIVTF